MSHRGKNRPQDRKIDPQPGRLGQLLGIMAEPPAEKKGRAETFREDEALRRPWPA